MSSLNRVMLIGRLGKAPELRYSQNGNPILNMSLATDESFMDRDGVRQERTEWHSLVCFNNLAENCAQYLDKGSLVYAEGSLATRKWQASDGTDRYTTEVRVQRIQFLDRKSAHHQGGAQQSSAETQTPPAKPSNRGRGRKSVPDPEPVLDDVPF